MRLPTAAGYAPAVDKEDRWLPILGPQLPVPVPLPVAKGSPAEGYPFNWSVRRWLDGEPATANTVTDMSALAINVATFICALQRVDATDWPSAGAHSFVRGASLEHYDAETRVALDVLTGRIDAETAEAVWNIALGSVWDSAPVWFHGDIASGNLLVSGGRLAAVIDFGTSGVGNFVRSGDRLDYVQRRQPGRVQGRDGSEINNVGTGSRLGTVEGADLLGARHRCQPRCCGRQPAGDRQRAGRLSTVERLAGRLSAGEQVAGRPVPRV